MFLLFSLAFGAEGLWEDVDARTGEALDRMKLSVDGVWADGRNVVVDLSIGRFDRMLDPRSLRLDEVEPPLDTVCMDKDGGYQYCWVDEGRRRVRVAFSAVRPEGRHVLSWYGVTVAELDVKAGTSPVFPPIDYELQEQLDFRVPGDFDVTGSGEVVDDEHPADPGRRWLVVDGSYSGAPASILGSSLRVKVDGWEEFGPVFAECATKKGPLDSCEPLPERGTIRLVYSVPRGVEVFSMVFGERELGKPQEVEALEAVEVSGRLLDALPTVPDADPLTPLRVWSAEFDGPSLWVDFRIDGPLPPFPDLAVFDPELGIQAGFAPRFEYYAEDPGESVGVPVPAEGAAFVRAAWSVYEIPTEAVIASNGRALGDALDVAPSGPRFSDRTVGIHLVDIGRLTEAIEPLQRAIAADPGDGAAMGALAWAYDRLGETALAYEWAAKGLDHGADYRDELFVIAGKSATALERYDDAQVILERGLEELKGNPLLQLQLGTVHRRKGDLPGAEQWLLRAARSDGSGEAYAELSDVMALQDQRSHAALALLDARLLNPWMTGSEDQRAKLVEWVTPKATWTGGSAVRGPLFAVTPMRVSSSEPAVAAAQVEYLMLAYAKAAADGRKDQRLRTDPWYTVVPGLIERIVAADLTEAAAWKAISRPGEWPVKLNVAVERVDRLVEEHVAQMQR